MHVSWAAAAWSFHFVRFGVAFGSPRLGCLGLVWWARWAPRFLMVRLGPAIVGDAAVVQARPAEQRDIFG